MTSIKRYDIDGRFEETSEGEFVRFEDIIIYLSEQDYQYNKQTNKLIARHATQIKMLEQQNLALIEQLVEVDLLTPRTYTIELPEGSTLLIGGE